MKEEKKKNNDFDDFYERLTVLLDTFLFREVNNVHSLWKRESDYQKTCKELTFPDDKKSFKPFVLLKNDSINIKIFILQIKKVEKILEKDNVVLIYNICPPKIFSEDIKTGLVFYENDNITVPAAEISPYIKSLKAVANETPNIHISLVSKDIKDKKKLFNNCKKIINKGLNDYIMESIIPKP